MFNDYILTNILKHINSGKDYKSCCLVSKQWFSVINQLFPGGDKFANHLLTLLKLFPNQNWNYLELSRNPNITIDYIAENLDKKWYFTCLTSNKRFTLTDILNNPKIPWDKNIITYNRNIPANNEDWEFILQHPEYNWDYSYLCSNKGLSWDIVINNLDKFGDYVSLNPNITTSIIRNNPQLNWNFDMMTDNPAVTLEFIEEYIDQNWYFYWLADHKKITTHPRAMELFYNKLDRIGIHKFSEIATQEMIEKYPNLEWDHHELSYNDNITYDFIKKHPEISWNFHNFSSNINVNINIVLENPKLDWNYRALTRNYGIKITDILNNPSLPWNKKELSERKDLTWRIVAKHSELINFNMLSLNKFNYKK